MNARTRVALLAGALMLVLVGCQHTPSVVKSPGPDMDESWETGSGPVVKTKIPQKRRWKPVYFAYDQSSIGETERAKLDKIYGYLRDNRDFDLLVEGHCDERGSEEYNRALGERRAIAVRDYLVALGLSKSRVHTLSFGEEKPTETGKSEESFRLNRRAELVVISAKQAAASK